MDPAKDVGGRYVRFQLVPRGLLRCESNNRVNIVCGRNNRYGPRPQVGNENDPMQHSFDIISIRQTANFRAKVAPNGTIIGQNIVEND